MIKWILSSSVLIGAVIGLRYLFRGKISARLQYALWALVLIRLLMPSGIFSMPLSVENLVNAVQSQPVVQNIITDLQEPGLDYNEAYEQAKDQILTDPPQTGQSYRPDVETSLALNERTNLLIQASTPSIVIKSIFIGIWYIGIAVIAITFLVSHIRFTLKLRRKRQLLRKEKIRIFTCEGLDTPCLFGLFRPAIYLTPEDAADEERSQHILAHEQTHRKHWDHIWSFLRCVCLAIHWYNPLVWIAAIASRQDGELACDEATIKKLGEEQRIPYGETLVKTTCAAKSTTGILRTATTMTGSSKSIKQRIMRIAHKFKFNVYAFISVILVAAISIGCTWFGAVESDDDIVTVYLIDQEIRTTYSNSRTSHYIWEYDDNYNLISATDSWYQYDENNRLLSKKISDTTIHYRYNDQGQIVECSGISDIYDEQTYNYNYNYNYTYDSQGRVIRCEGNHCDINFTVDYSYDSNGILRTSTKYRSNGSRVFKNYNAQGNLVKEEHYDGSTLTCIHEYTYDIFGRVVTSSSMETGYNDSIYYDYYTYSYDLFGRLVKVVYDNEGTINMDPSAYSIKPYTLHYYYDLQGNVIKVIKEFYDGKESTFDITYDIYGRVTRYQADPGVDRRYTYDGNGNIISETTYSADGKVIDLNTYTYTAVHVSRKDAERLLAQQDSSIFFNFESHPQDPMPEKEEFYP